MIRVLMAALLLSGCASGRPDLIKPTDEKSVEAYMLARPSVLAIPTLDRVTAPALPADLAAAHKLVRVKLAVCTDVDGNPTDFVIETGSGDSGFDRAVQKWIAKMPFTPALNMKRDPIETCETKLDMLWSGKVDDAAAGEPMARPVNPLLLPVYPAGARRRHETGPSNAKICIEAQGKVTDIQESASPSPILGEAFDAWLREIPFQPSLRDGKPEAACGLGFGLYWTLSS